METLQKKSLFWDVEFLDPQKYGKFIVERILTFGDQEDFRWALNFYGKDRIKQYFSESKNLDKKSSSFWRQYFNNAHGSNQ
jgi:hypothetical protein